MYYVLMNEGSLYDTHTHTQQNMKESVSVLFPDGTGQNLRSDTEYLLNNKLQPQLGLGSEGKVQRSNIARGPRVNTLSAFLRYLSRLNFSTALEIPLTLHRIHASLLHAVLGGWVGVVCCMYNNTSSRN